MFSYERKIVEFHEIDCISKRVQEKDISKYLASDTLKLKARLEVAKICTALIALCFLINVAYRDMRDSMLLIVKQKKSILSMYSLNTQPIMHNLKSLHL